MILQRGTARVWGADPSGQYRFLKELKGHTDGVDGLCWDPRNKDLATDCSIMVCVKAPGDKGNSLP